ncbi:DUF341 domain protein [Dothidotthia symphoricarpi CBS 119687]|uniref:DUF341 domain protein n=1 Tax=Dothidotthia symphoricarpi CBS 119687 TaxID=1392245 RepID=A0A6A6AFK2_9PLEO|nr:DUF341 domain protein [Dothidotthia symphoricarpi CBS 119687]KAF2129724.1 DUF341 domain protein [Dothidotthia symphoricarpi CBS 119687]
MRLLCLHGVGSSANILENQLRSFLQAVDPAYEFIFVDGPFASPRGPGVSAHVEGPFFSHTVGYSPLKMAEALDYIDETLDELGPFDGVLGFSQGAAVLIAYMYQHEACRKPLPFKFALIFSSVMPCSDDIGYCQGIFDRLRSHRRELTAPPAAGAVPSPLREERIFIDLLLRTVVPARKNRAMLPDFDLGVYTEGDGLDAPRLMHPLLLKERIHIPTVHITGKRDSNFMRSMSEAARGLCDDKLVKKLEHGGGHHPPQKDVEIKAVIRAMDWAIAQSQKGLSLHL